MWQLSSRRGGGGDLCGRATKKNTFLRLPLIRWYHIKYCAPINVLLIRAIFFLPFLPGKKCKKKMPLGDQINCFNTLTKIKAKLLWSKHNSFDNLILSFSFVYSLFLQQKSVFSANLFTLFNLRTRHSYPSSSFHRDFD